MPGRGHTETVPQPERRGRWYEDAAQVLVAHAQAKVRGGVSKTAAAEAKQRSSALATTSDKRGVSFAGAAFQAEYFKSKFRRRGKLLEDILCDLRVDWTATGCPPGRALGGQGDIIDGLPIRVASFGGGPGTDAAGLVGWQQGDPQRANIRFSCTLYDYEATWKRYTKTLAGLFQPTVADLCFHPCNVTVPLNDAENRKVDVGGVQLLLFFYVCHETSLLARKGGHQFYSDVARQATDGAIVIIADVTDRSRADLQLVADAMAKERRIELLQLTRVHKAEVVAFRIVAGRPMANKKAPARSRVVSGGGQKQQARSNAGGVATVVTTMAPAFKL